MLVTKQIISETNLPRQSTARDRQPNPQHTEHRDISKCKK